MVNWFACFCIDYLFSALTRRVDRFRYLSRSIINRRSRRFARQIRLAAFCTDMKRGSESDRRVEGRNLPIYSSPSSWLWQPRHSRKAKVESGRFVQDRWKTSYWVDARDWCSLRVYVFSACQWQLEPFHSLLSDVALRLELVASKRRQPREDLPFGTLAVVLPLSLSVSI